MQITINDCNLQNLETFTQILKKDESTLINEALELFFQEQQKKLLEKNIEDENALTNLNYDEFWDGVDIE
jgi:hypothetical protein